MAFVVREGWGPHSETWQCDRSYC